VLAYYRVFRGVSVYHDTIALVRRNILMYSELYLGASWMSYGYDELKMMNLAVCGVGSLSSVQRSERVSWHYCACAYKHFDTLKAAFGRRLNDLWLWRAQSAQFAGMRCWSTIECPEERACIMAWLGLCVRTFWCTQSCIWVSPEWAMAMTSLKWWI
jgi:hypothetical protein